MSVPLIWQNVSKKLNKFKVHVWTVRLHISSGTFIFLLNIFSEAKRFKLKVIHILLQSSLSSFSFSHSFLHCKFNLNWLSSFISNKKNKTLNLKTIKRQTWFLFLLFFCLYVLYTAVLIIKFIKKMELNCLKSLGIS